MKNTLSTERIVALMKCLVAAYLITGALLLLVSGLLYKFSLSEDMVEIGIIAVYCISSLLAGLFFSKGAKSRRFIWGMLAGTAYFVIICAISVAAEPNFEFLSNSCITTFFICIGSGMLGGMIG